ncbi:MAG: class I SAM-dependent methyltransferase [Dehalogenimonas sp.]
MDICEYNRKAWDHQVKSGNKWTVPVTEDTIQKAFNGDWQIVLTPTIPVPRDWFPPVKGAKVLCLASGGGQQGPVLAAAGACVATLDNSPSQLNQERLTADNNGLEIQTILRDMRNLEIFGDNTFDFIVHPVSNVFVPDVNAVWKESYRVLRDGGVLLSGFMNPSVFLFDWRLAENTGELRVKYPLPYSDENDLEESEKQDKIKNGEPFDFSHTLNDQIGGQIKAGFVIDGFYEDRSSPEDNDPLEPYMATCIATRAVKMKVNGI